MANASGRERAKDIISALLFMAIGGIFLRELSGLPENVTRYPSILIYLIVALSLILGAKALVGVQHQAASLRATTPEADHSVEAGPATGASEQPVKFGFATGFVIVVSFLYVLAMPYIGFTLASALMLVIFMLVMGVRSLPVLILVPLVEISFLLFVFEYLLAVFLPDAQPLKDILGMGV